MYDYLSNKNDKDYEHQKEMLLQNYNEKTALNNKYFFFIYNIFNRLLQDKWKLEDEELEMKMKDMLQAKRENEEIYENEKRLKELECELELKDLENMKGLSDVERERRLRLIKYDNLMKIEEMKRLRQEESELFGNEMKSIYDERIGEEKAKLENERNQMKRLQEKQQELFDKATEQRKEKLKEMWYNNYRRKVDTKLNEIRLHEEKIRSETKKDFEGILLTLEKEREKDIELENDLKIKTDMLDEAIDYHVYTIILLYY